MTESITFTFPTAIEIRRCATDARRDNPVCVQCASAHRFFVAQKATNRCAEAHPTEPDTDKSIPRALRSAPARGTAHTDLRLEARTFDKRLEGSSHSLRPRPAAEASAACRRLTDLPAGEVTESRNERDRRR